MLPINATTNARRFAVRKSPEILYTIKKFSYSHLQINTEMDPDLRHFFTGPHLFSLMYCTCNKWRNNDHSFTDIVHHRVDRVPGFLISRPNWFPSHPQPHLEL